tara:strand:- start:1418 stop:2098 length:681 start_codon:yes stop_codon:yes gene_type:complete
MVKNTAIALLSGGIDSMTATGLAIEEGNKVIGLSFDYGQRHLQELEAAASIAKSLNLIDHQIIKVNLAAWGGSSLTDMRKELPIQGVVEGVIPNTYVPGRNTIFIAIGLSLAEARGANKIILGINAMDYSGYPDCRPDYIDAYQKLANLSSKASREGNEIKLWAPLLHLKKTTIIKEALRLKLPITSTWSCYSNEALPCGECDSCRIRDTAFREIGRIDLSSQHKK